MTEYNIIQKLPGHEILYFDPFTNKVFKGSKSEAQKILFLLEDQQDGVFEIREAVQV